MTPAAYGSAPVLLVGGGRMGQALLKGWLNAPDIGPVFVVEPNPAAGLAALIDGQRVRLIDGPDKLPQGLAGLTGLSVIIAIKPQMFDQVLPAYKNLALAGTLILSIAAGRTLSDLGRLLGNAAGFVRAMPNTPAEVGRGITALVAGEDLAADARRRAELLMQAVGEIAWVSREDDINTVTAISGSGPAYVFLLVEALTKAGMAQGLSPDQAAQFARATIIGAGRLLEHATDSPKSLREAVTSPGGTTAAALGVLMATPHVLEEMIDQAVTAALARARALAG